MENDTNEVSVNPDYAKCVKEAATRAAVGVIVTIAVTQVATYAMHKVVAWRKARKTKLTVVKTTATEK